MIYCDTEYNDRKPILWCSWSDKDPTDQIVEFDLRSQNGVDGLKNYVEANLDEVFAAYSASAEVTTLLRLGIDVTKLKVVDLMVEARMITLSYPFSDKGFNSAKGDLLSQLKYICGFEVAEDERVKEKMRDLIISNDFWTDEEWVDIVKYCKQDIKHLPSLFKTIKAYHGRLHSELLPEDLLKRGYYVRICAEMDFASKGFPLYEPHLRNIYRNKKKAIKAIIKSLPDDWRKCYRVHTTGPKKGEFKMNLNAISDLIKNKGWSWGKTDTGKPQTDKEYLKELKMRIPEVNPFYQAKKSLSVLNSVDLSPRIKNGYMKTSTYAYSASTSRNGLRPKMGYLLNLPKWMRKCITPHPGMALVGFDYSQQEIAIAAAISGDSELKKAYASGDIYLTLGKMSGLIPQDGTKQTHSKERQIMKALQLGLQFGKGLKGVQLTLAPIFIEIDSNITPEQALTKAEKIFDWHRQHFRVYWGYIEDKVKKAYILGYMSSLDNWRVWCNNTTRKTQLLNFPSQSNGAYMLREAVKLCYTEWKNGNLPPLLCSQHDALYFNIETKDVDIMVPLIRNIMTAASLYTIDFEVRVDSNIYTMDEPYEPEGFGPDDQKLWDLIKELDNPVEDKYK